MMVPSFYNNDKVSKSKSTYYFRRGPRTDIPKSGRALAAKGAQREGMMMIPKQHSTYLVFPYLSPKYLHIYEQGTYIHVLICIFRLTVNNEVDEGNQLSRRI